MKRIIPLVFLVLPLFVTAQKDSLSSGVFKWKEPDNKSKNKSSTVLFEGSTYSMEWMQVSANTITPVDNNKKAYSKVSANEERLLIIKSGSMNINIGDSSHSISGGSLILLLPGQGYYFKNENETSCSYYLLKYRSKQPVDTARGKASGGLVVKDWNTVEFKPNEKGGRRNFFERPTAMCKRLEIHVTTLKEGLQSHAPHTHKAAEFTLIKEGITEMQIGGQLYKGGEGSVYYAPSNMLHNLQNTGTGNCTYFAIQFE